MGMYRKEESMNEPFTIKVDYSETKQGRQKNGKRGKHADDILAKWYAELFEKLGFKVIGYGSTPVKEKNIRVKLHN